MKTLFSLFCLLLLSACASSHNGSRTGASGRVVVCPNGTVVVWSGTNCVVVAGTPNTGMTKPVSLPLFAASDKSRGGGVFLLTDPRASALDSSHTNQGFLGGGRHITLGTYEAVISTNAVKTISDTVGQVVKDAIQGAKSAP